MFVISWSSVECCGSDVFTGGMYMFAMWICLCCVRLILVIWSSVLLVLMLLGMLSGVYDMPSLMYVSSPPPCLCCLSVRMAAKLFMFGVLLFLLSLVSCTVIMSILCVFVSCSSSVVLRCSPLMLI